MKRGGIAGVLLAAGIIMFCVLCFLFPYLNPVYDNQGDKSGTEPDLGETGH